MVLTGVMSKMGVYGFLRVLMPLFPDQVLEGHLRRVAGLPSGSMGSHNPEGTPRSAGDQRATV
jgi:hypothetical protein